MEQAVSDTDLTWVDGEGVRHIMTKDGATKVLKRFYEEWPGTFDEIESVFNTQTEVQFELEQEKIKVAMLESEVRGALDKISELEEQLKTDGENARIMLDAVLAENQSLRGRLLEFRNLAKRELSKPL